MPHTRTHKLILSAMFAAILCIVGPIAFFIGPVPVSLGTLGLFVLAGFLPWKNALASTGIYLLLGMVGLPVFSGFVGGLAKVAGPTGGYLVGYLPCVLITCLFLQKRKNWKRFFLGAGLGTLICYMVGSLWFMLVMEAGFAETLTICVLPFLPGDIAKIFAAWFLVYSCRRKGSMIK